MPAAWPSAPFPQLPITEDYTESPPNGAIRTEMDAGPAKVRRRYTSGPRTLHVTVYMTSANLTAASPNGFDAFYVTDTSMGTAEWTWTSPSTGAAITCRFLDRPVYTPLGSSSNYAVSFNLEILP